MGHLLPAVTQQKLDIQRGVVQNEKRGDDNQPGGLLQYSIQQTLFPASNPYHHTVIGSMSDLDTASLEVVKDWFRIALRTEQRRARPRRRHHCR